MINQSEQSSNQYGFYAVPKAVQPRKKYREPYEQDIQYQDDQNFEDDNDNLFESLDQQQQNEKQLERDYYVNQAPYPDFKPKQRGLDYGVQIQKQDLFDFDLEVQPLIQILVGRSVVTAINELQQEKQNTNRHETLDIYQKKRNAELMVTQRLETKNKRKKQETQRRKLQKDIYVKNKKQATKKLISRKNAKHSLLNLKTQVLSQLQEDGYLREQTYLSLRIQYEGWLYQQIRGIINEQLYARNTLENMVKQNQRQLEDEHQKSINKQKNRRKEILDERQRIRKYNQERKMKKKIRKQRLQLNGQRQEKATKAHEQVQKYEHVEKILKAGTIGNGLTVKKNAAGTVQIAGGLFNYIVAYLISTEKKYTPQEIEAILDKILKQLTGKLQVQFSTEHYQKIEELRSKMSSDQISFMKNKDSEIEQLVSQISADISLLESTQNHIPSDLHQNLIKTLLRISLTCLPEPKKEGEQIIDSYDATDIDKKRQETKQKIQLSAQDDNFLALLKQSEEIVRVRFQRIKPQKSQKQQEKQEGQQKKEIDLDEWIDVYDGEGWKHKLNKDQKQCEKQAQSAVSYTLPSFENALVVDQRNIHYLGEEMQKLLGVKAGQSLKTYSEKLNCVRSAADNIPIYDVQLEWE